MSFWSKTFTYQFETLVTKEQKKYVNQGDTVTLGTPEGNIFHGIFRFPFSNVPIPSGKFPMYYRHGLGYWHLPASCLPPANCPHSLSKHQEQKKYVNQGDTVTLGTPEGKKELEINYLEEDVSGAYRAVVYLPQGDGGIGITLRPRGLPYYFLFLYRFL